MNELRDFAGQETSSSEEVTSLEGFTKDGKTLPTPVSRKFTQRWAIWAAADAYSDGRNVGVGSIGIDYRLKPHWLIGAYANVWYAQRTFWQIGAYTAFYERGFWGVAGGEGGVNDCSAFSSTGYDFKLGAWTIGPVVSIQFDSQPVDRGFGRGNLFQTRVGGRIAYTTGRMTVELQAMYERQSINNVPSRANALWLGLGVNYSITSRWSVYGAYSLDANGAFQEHQVDIGCRYSF